MYTITFKKSWMIMKSFFILFLRSLETNIFPRFTEIFEKKKEISFGATSFRNNSLLFL